MQNDFRKLRIVFFGTPDFAVATLKVLIEQGCTVIAVVTTPDKPAGRGLQMQHSAVHQFAQLHGLRLLQPAKLRDASFLATLRSFNADLFIVVAFRMLPKIVWDMPPMGTINVHASLLPNYRGAAPINHAIINGESITGVTTFRLKHAIDTGDILLQKPVTILPSDNAGLLYEKLKMEGAHLLIKTLEGLAHNELVPIPQKADEAHTYPHAPKLHKAMMQIDWLQSAAQIHNLIRGLAPYPAAITSLDGKNLKILEAEPIKEQHLTTPGFYLSDGKTYLKFATADGWLFIKTLQHEGKKTMDVQSFLRGYRFPIDNK